MEIAIHVRFLRNYVHSVATVCVYQEFCLREARCRTGIIIHMFSAIDVAQHTPIPSVLLVESWRS